MPTLKHTLIFEGRARGWTESYYRPGAGGDHDAQLGPAMQLINFRKQLLGIECRIKALRISTEGTGPDALLKYVDLGWEAPRRATKVVEPVDPPTSAQPDVALLLRCQNQGRTKFKHIFLRGIWDVVEDLHGKYTPTAEWTANITKFMDYLKDEDWGWFGVASKTKERLVTATSDAQDLVTFGFDGPLFPVGLVGKRTKVRISGVNNGKSVINRTHVVQVLTTSTCKTEYTTACPNIVIGGFGAHQLYDYIDIKHIDAQKIVTRECGAPLLESPGRRKAMGRA